MKSIVKFISKIKEQSKKQKGFKTNSVAIKEYLFQFISYLKGKVTYIQEIQNCWSIFMINWINLWAQLP